MDLSCELFKITGKLVFLRKFSLTDAAKVFGMSREKGMQQWIPDQVYADLKESESVLSYLIQQYAASKSPAEVPIVFAVCSGESGELIGHVGLSPAAGKVEIGYAIEDSQQRRGYAADAIKAASSWALSCYSLPDILGIVAAANIASCKALEKAGFTLSEEKERVLHGKIQLVKIYSFSLSK
jgi:RimJ/RimL family protein N-acetyltransferase